MTDILGETQSYPSDAFHWAKSKGAPDFWAVLADPFWEIMPQAGVRPEVAWVQACKETGFGRFGRAVTPGHHNTCGAKIPNPGKLPDDAAGAHQYFPTWQAGIHAHADHLALYAGAPSYPRTYLAGPMTIYGTIIQYSGATWDPRHFPFLWGIARTVEELGGKWAPAVTYGLSIVTSLNDLLSYKTT